MAAGPLVIVTPHRKEIQREFEHAFKRRFPSASVQWKAQSGTGDALRYVHHAFAQSSKSGIDADLFFGGGPEAFLELEAHDLLQPLPSDYGVPPELNGVPLRSYDKRWVAAALSQFGILYNQTLRAQRQLPVPDSWAALAKPELRDQVALVDPRRSGSARVIYESILQLYGWERGWQVLTAMAANSPNFATSSSKPLDNVAQGRVIFAPSVNFLAQNAVESSQTATSFHRLAYTEPQGEQIITPDPIGILRGAPHLPLARLFVDFVLSSEGQSIWMFKRGSEEGPKQANLYRLSVLPSLYQPLSPDSLVRRDPYTQSNVRLYDAQKAAQRHKVLEDFIGAVLIENHQVLRARWKQNPDARRLPFMPLSEQQMAALSTRWHNAALRASTIKQWKLEARRHFKTP